METEAFHLFLLMTTLSRLKEGPRTIELFLESVEDIFPGLRARWLTGGEVGEDERCMQVCTREIPFGSFAYRPDALRSGVEAALLQNAAQMLGSILEKQQQEKLLLDQNLHLEALVEERTRHLQQTTEELQHYFDHALDLFCIADHEGRFLRLNRQWEATLGYPLSELVGRPFIELVHPADVAATLEAVAQLRARASVMDFVNRYRTRDGSYRWIEWRSFPHGALIYAAARDTTERRKLDESLQRAQKLESIAVLAGGIAHDFNNLLSGIFGFLELTQESVVQGDAGEALDCLKNAQEVYDRAKALTQQLLTFSKGGAPVLRTLSVAEPMRRSAEFVLSGSAVACHFHVAPDLWSCDCDENQIGQVIDNIVINARDAMPEGGNVTLSAENREGDYGPGRRGRFVLLSIADDGPGIEPHLLGRVFDPFFSTKPTGHGLGLSTVFSIVKRHGGWVDVESELGRGTVFRVYLPASRGPAEAVAAGAPRVRAGSGRILVMDDEPFMLQILARMLRSRGYEAVSARDGQAAIDLFSRALREEQPFLLCILDLTVPGGMGGAKAAAAIRALDATTALVAASGYSEDPIMAEPTAHGFDASLSKPFRSADLGALVERLLAARERRRE